MAQGGVMRHPRAMPADRLPAHGVARVLSKQGRASRSQASAWVRDGRVQVNGRVVTDPEFRVRMGQDVVTVSGQAEAPAERVYVMLNKPRGLVTSTSDEQGRDTVYQCFEGSGLPWMGPVGRLDKASEGLLLFSNDTTWAAAITAPESHLDKAYSVQVNRVASSDDLERMRAGIVIDGERHAVKRVAVLRSGGKNSWLEIVLDEGKNRQIRRILAALGMEVLRLIRIRIGVLDLGPLAKGQWRRLDGREVAQLTSVPS
jgi:23S rRNA pseudouridine2605 synthase